MRSDRQVRLHVPSSYVVMWCGALNEESHYVFVDALSTDSKLVQAEDPHGCGARVRA